MFISQPSFDKGREVCDFRETSEDSKYSSTRFCFSFGIFGITADIFGIFFRVIVFWECLRKLAKNEASLANVVQLASRYKPMKPAPRPYFSFTNARFHRIEQLFQVPIHVG